MASHGVLQSATIVFAVGAVGSRAYGAAFVAVSAAVSVVSGVWWAFRSLQRRVPRSGCGRRPGPKPGRAVLWSLVLLGAGVSTGAALSPRPCERALATHAQSPTVALTGTVTGVPVAGPDDRWRGQLRIHSADGDRAVSGATVALVVDHAGNSQASLVQRLVPGTVVEARGRLYLPQPPANPGEPDMRIVLACRGVAATLYVRSAGDVRFCSWPSQVPVLATAASWLRRRFVGVIEDTLPPGQARMLSGMLFGSAPEEMEGVLEATGTSHLFAVSGLHVGLVATLIGSILTGIGLGGPRAVVPAIACSWLYAAVCGMRPAVVRAAAMISCAGVASLLHRRASAQGALWFAALLALVSNPLLAFDPGAQMSFSAVFTILRFSLPLRRALKRLPPWLADPLATSLAAQLGVTPLSIWHFGTFSPVGIFASVPALALAGVAVITGFAAAVVGLACLPIAAVLNAGNAVALVALEWVIRTLAGFPFSSVSVSRPPLWALLAFYFALVAASAPRAARRSLWAHRGTLAVMAVALGVAAMWVAALRPSSLEVVFLSVGQGDAAFVRSPSGRTALVDGGGALGPLRNAGDEVVAPYLLRRGTRRIDVVVATHPHDDHVRGLLDVIRRFEVGVVLTPFVPAEARAGLSRDLVAISRERGVRVVEVVQGGSVDFGDGATVEFLGPRSGGGPRSAAGINDGSIVMMLRFRDAQLLFTGDAGPGVLQALANAGLGLHADVLKVPHHGANGACPSEFLRSVSPKWAVVSVGPNLFGHPAAGTMDALARVGARVLRTDLNGAVMVTARGSGIRVRAMRGT